jgi:hypothetical protein
MSKVKLIYIVSASHSGSTLLDLLLSHHSRIQGVGEVMHLDEWVNKDLLCTCTNPISRCPFWSNILSKLNAETPFQLNGFIKSALANSTPAFHFGFDKKKNSYATATYRLFSTIQHLTGKDYILDSSKSLGRLKALLLSDKFEIKVLHLIRDVRSVAASGLKQHIRPSFQAETRTKKIPVSITALKWLLGNWSLENIAKSQSFSYQRVFYEDLVLDPAAVMTRVVSSLDLEWDSLCLQPKSEDVHNISGSRWRFAKNTNVSPHFLKDPQLKGYQKVLIAAISGWKNRRYGYR